MARMHALLSGERWRSVAVRTLVEALVPAEASQAFRLEGPDIFVPPRQATALAMVVHELITNSLKYGALGAPTGRVWVEWTLAECNGDSRVRWTWREAGGSPITTEPTPGIGTSLIQGLTRSELRGSVELGYGPDGAEHVFDLTLDSLDSTNEPSLARPGHRGAGFTVAR